VPIPAAMYLRMSTEHQQYSLDNQAAAIQAYALKHGFEIVQTYSDAARSGFVLKQRKALRTLLENVVAGGAGYKAILVYDVSRWGRFQDADEAAHYEFICKAAGVRTHYCAEAFDNDGTMPNAIMKMLKRTMAGEYSRELSVKVRDGLRRIAQRGFSTGGSTYGFRRMQVSIDREQKGVLARGQRKDRPEDRVILVPGPPAAVANVREIFRLFVKEGKMPKQIAGILCKRGVPYTGLSRKEWCADIVNGILHNPKYAGYLVFGRTSELLQTRSVPRPREEWIVLPGAWKAIVSPELFDLAQQKFRNQTVFKTDDELLEALRLLFKNGRLSQRLVSRDRTVAAPRTYVGRFGSLTEAFAKIGYKDPSHFQALETRRLLAKLRVQLIKKITAACPPGSIAVAQRDGHTKPSLVVRDQWCVSIYLCRCVICGTREPYWRIENNTVERLPISLVARLNHQNDEVRDLFVMPTPTRFVCCGSSGGWLTNATPLLELSDFPYIVEEAYSGIEGQRFLPLEGAATACPRK
jgi:DNA invertase Pin-like site-specific DNA recombinase